MIQAADAAAAQRLKHRFDKVDPIAAKQASQRRQSFPRMPTSPTVRPSARNVQAHHDKWQATRNRDYTRDRMARMTKHIFPTLGDRDTATITRA